MLDVDGLIILNTIDEVRYLNMLNDPSDDIFIFGGSKIYEKMLPFSDKIYLTRINHKFDNVSAYFPDINVADWKVVKTDWYDVEDERNDYSFTISLLERY